MDEEAGRPTFDLSSFLTFAFPAAEQDQPSLQARTEIITLGSGDPEEQQDLSSRHSDLTDGEDDGVEDLAKYGPPDALMRVSQAVPPTVMEVIKDSIGSVQAQVTAETDLRCRQKEEEKLRAEEERRQVDVNLKSIGTGKGKAVEGAQSLESAIAQISSAASDRTDYESFYTPSEGQTPTGDTNSEVATEEATEEDTDVDATSTPRPKVISASAIYPRRRDLLKAVLRKISDTDTRRRIVRRSTGGLRHPELRAKFKLAKQLLQHTDPTETAYVLPATSSVH